VVERGSFLALDLGGTNFRVLLITLTDSDDVDIKNTIFAISNELMTGSGTKVHVPVLGAIVCPSQLSRLQPHQWNLGCVKLSVACEKLRGGSRNFHLGRPVKGQANFG